MTLGRCVGAIAAAAAVVLASAAAAWDTPKDGLRPVPPLSSQVTDLTGTLSASERQALESKLHDWEARTTNQLVVLMVPTTAPEPIEEYTLRVAEAWKIGQKGKDNGAIFLIAKDDKRMRIEVGYGFEGVLTDVTSRRIIGETVAITSSRASSRRVSTLASTGSLPLSAPESRCRQIRPSAPRRAAGSTTEPCLSCCWWRFRSSERCCARFSATSAAPPSAREWPEPRRGSSPGRC